MVKLPMTTFLTNLKPAVGYQPRQQFMNLERHSRSDQILPRVPRVEGTSRLPVLNPGHASGFSVVDSGFQTYCERITFAMSRGAHDVSSRLHAMLASYLCATGNIGNRVNREHG